MGRGLARKTDGVSDLVRQTEGVACRKDGVVLDEAPKAYKNMMTALPIWSRHEPNSNKWSASRDDQSMVRRPPLAAYHVAVPRRMGHHRYEQAAGAVAQQTQTQADQEMAHED